MVLGSLGCFLVIESREHAAARGGRASRTYRRSPRIAAAGAPGEATAKRHATARRRCARTSMPPHAAVISGASGVSAPTDEEAEFLRGLGLPVRGTATAFGHSLEPSFPANLALAAIALSQRRLFAPLETADSKRR